ncbi:hypothetical protein BDV06DRAFT_189133 [Aspergillus oleicola]
MRDAEQASTKSCIACSWTPKQQSQCYYTSNVKLFYGASTRGTWSIGSDMILKNAQMKVQRPRLRH